MLSREASPASHFSAGKILAIVDGGRWRLRSNEKLRNTNVKNYIRLGNDGPGYSP